MNKVIAFFVLVIICVGMAAGLIWLATGFQDSAAGYEISRGHAESEITRAQGQATLDRAEARAAEAQAQADAAIKRAEAEANVIRAEAQAEAERITAQSQARVDAAQMSILTAAATTQNTVATLQAGYPWGIMGILGILGLSIVALSFAVIGRSQQNQPRVIERIVVERLPEPKHRMLPQGNHWQLPAQVNYPIEWIERG